MPGDVKKPFKELFDQNESNKVQKRQHDTLVKEEAQHLAAEHAAKQAKLVQQSVRVGLKSLEVAEADLAIAKFFYANGLAFSAASAEQESYYREMIRKIQRRPRQLAMYLPAGKSSLARCWTRPTTGCGGESTNAIQMGLGQCDTVARTSPTAGTVATACP